MEQDIRYLTLLSKEFPSVQSACAVMPLFSVLATINISLTEPLMVDLTAFYPAAAKAPGCWR